MCNAVTLYYLFSPQCINVTDVKWITQQKTVVERVCSDVPDQECKINTVIQDKPVNSTECKIVKENKCSIITVPTKEKECRKVFEKKCRTVSEIVTNIVQVREAFKKIKTMSQNSKSLDGFF